MFRFESNFYLWILTAVPLIYIAWRLAAIRMAKRWDKLGEGQRLRASSIPSDSFLFFRKYGIYVYILLVAIGLANPQLGRKTEKVQTQNVEVFLLLDVSKSMLATDIQPNRLARAKIWIKQFTENFSSERIGLISFAGSAYLQSPLTTDAAIIQTLASSAYPASVSVQGTSLAAAIELARKCFLHKDGFHKVIVLLSDGEDHEGRVQEEAKKAREEGITIFTVPIGTESGAAVPNIDNSNEPFLRNDQGEIIISMPNRKLLREIADISYGDVIELEEGGQGFEKMKKKFAALAKKELTFRSVSEYQSFYQWPAFAMILFLLLEISLSKRKSHES